MGSAELDGSLCVCVDAIMGTSSGPRQISHTTSQEEEGRGGPSADPHRWSLHPSSSATHDARCHFRQEQYGLPTPHLGGYQEVYQWPHQQGQMGGEPKMFF